MLSNLNKSFKIVYKEKLYIVLTIVQSLIFVFLYLTTIEISSSLNTYFKSNGNFLIITELLLITLNSLFLSFALTFLFFILKSKTKYSEFGIVRTVFSSIFTFSTTGCYVCGSILLPSLGLGASIATTPFSGPIIKFLSLIILIYTVNIYAKSILGTCDFSDKLYKLEYSDNKFILIKKTTLNFLLNTILIVTFVGLSYLLPWIFVKTDMAPTTNEFACFESNS